jgi:ApaG protein
MAQISKVQKSLENKFFTMSKNIITNPYTSKTQGIDVAVWPEFIDSNFATIGDIFVWAYHIRIDNQSSAPIKLLNRHWHIIDEKGVVQEISGEGVVGEQPTILPSESYQYTSCVHLRHPSGIMKGKYQMQKSDGKTFDVDIPAFSLDLPSSKSVIN